MVVEPHHPLSESTNEDGLQVSGSFGADEVGCDVIFKTSDSVLLYVQSSTMRRMDPRVFQSLLPVVSTQDDKEIGVIDIPERREVLEIIIHALYDRAWLSDGGSLDHLEEALDLMSTYTVRPSLHIGASSHMHGILLQHAALSPFRVYALAARHGLQDLANGGGLPEKDSMPSHGTEECDKSPPCSETQSSPGFHELHAGGPRELGFCLGSGCDLFSCGHV
ncbi:hypothetical protein CC2G_011452 [Coprinopsis cinerea AmutBmut pab1-1]|nr:hypothetical protein CC2G_011452 [Coprinopsis cinerea AmutBmut pab1-1]